MEKNFEKILATQRMQDYIIKNYNREISMEDLAKAAAYSPWHSLRAFKEVTQVTPMEYIRQVRLSEGAKKLRDTNKSILNIALESAFLSHEGFTKAFIKEFKLTPKEYRDKAPPIKLFTYYPVTHRYVKREGRKNHMTSTVMFTKIIDKPERKIILKRGKKAKDYFQYFEEVNCDVWGMLSSIKGATDDPIGIWLPESLRRPGTSEYCQGVEVPVNFQAEVPEGFDIMNLNPCKYLVFQGEPFADEDFCQVIEESWAAIKKYNPENIGLKFQPEAGPRFQKEPLGERGYIEGLPVMEIKK